MEFLTKSNITLVVLGIVLIGVAVSFWRAHRNRPTEFDLIDLVMQDGKISRIGTAFMVTLCVSSWIVVNKQVTHELDPTTFGLWMTAWVGPLVARVVGNAFGKGSPGDAGAPETVAK